MIYDINPIYGHLKECWTGCKSAKAHKILMRTAGIHLHQPPSPVTAANQQQREGAAMWAEGSTGNDRLAARSNNSPDKTVDGLPLQVGKNKVIKGREWGWI